ARTFFARQSNPIKKLGLPKVRELTRVTLESGELHHQSGLGRVRVPRRGYHQPGFVREVAVPAQVQYSRDGSEPRGPFRDRTSGVAFPTMLVRELAPQTVFALGDGICLGAAGVRDAQGRFLCAQGFKISSCLRVRRVHFQTPPRADF
ncbi:MAG: hypothetical protein BJ554DRAFT_6966, partial [Olpidium bornovanus]